MLAFSNVNCGTSDTENGSPADSLLSGDPEDPGYSPETTRDTEEEGLFSDEFYSHDTDEDDEQGKKKRDQANSVLNLSLKKKSLFFNQRYFYN